MIFALWLSMLMLAQEPRPTEVSAAPAPRPCNIIILLADDVGAEELGCYGNSEHATPSIDRLAAEGVRFESAWATPLCSPTRVALMSGQYGFRTGWFNQIGRRLSPAPGTSAYELGARPTFGQLLRSCGYATALAGKWQLSGRQPTLVRECGFDEYLIWGRANELPEGTVHTGAFEDEEHSQPARYWHPCLVENGTYLPTRPEDYGPDRIQRFALDFIRAHKDGPFFLYYPSLLPHPPYEATPDPAQTGAKRPGGFGSSLEYLDHLTGELVDELDELGLRENTLLFWIGDNGTAGRGKGKLSELGVRVPVLVRCPGTVPAGVVSRALTDVTDVFPTLVELSGASLAPGQVLDGHSLLPVLRGASTRHRDWIFSYLEEGRLLRDERWLLLKPGAGRQTSLFDCGDARDGRSYRNVTRSDEPEVQAARARLEKLLENLPGPQGFPGLLERDEPGADEGASAPR